MVLDAVSNFVRGNTDAAVGADDTTVSVADASIFPDPSLQGEFNVVIWDANNFPRPDQDGDVEIMRVTARDTTADELTVTRGQETTSAATHPEGSAIHLSPTAKMFSDIESTFGDFWDAGAQELTADVNNTNTTTQALEAEELSNGVAGSDNTITRIGNDAGEYVVVGQIAFPSETASTTATSFNQATARSVMRFQEQFQNTNFEEDIYARVCYRHEAGDGTVRVTDSPETELSSESSTDFAGPVGSYRGASAPATDSTFVEFKSNDGEEFEIFRILIQFLARLEP